MKHFEGTRPAVRAAVLRTAVLTLIGCHDSPTAPVDIARFVTALSPLEQTGVAGAAIAVPPLVVVRDGGTQPVANVPVTFSGPMTSGRVVTTTVYTSADGTAGPQQSFSNLGYGSLHPVQNVPVHGHGRR